MEGAQLRNCNFEDPAGGRANMEGVNLKGANLEGSCMGGVNLRVATLKHAVLRNCDLRAAVLAGADLEVSFYHYYYHHYILSLTNRKSFLYIFFCYRTVICLVVIYMKQTYEVPI